MILFTFILSVNFLYKGAINSQLAYAKEEQSTEDELMDSDIEMENNIPDLDVPEMPDFDNYTLIETYEPEWSKNLYYDIRYDKYAVYPHYVVNLTYYYRKVYEEPDTSTDIYNRIYYGEKLQAVALVEDEKGKHWYAVICEYEDENVIGYMRESDVDKREFKLAEMNEYLNTLTDLHERGHIVYVENYRNANGYAPRMPNGSYYDDFGYRRGQSAVGYYDSSLEGDFRYIPDGMLGVVEEVIEITETKDIIIVIDNKGLFKESGDFEEHIDNELLTISEDTIEKIIKEEKEDNQEEEKTAVEIYNSTAKVVAAKIYIPSFGVSLWVDEKYLNEDKDAPDVLNQAIIVDRGQQSIGVFEYYSGHWRVISMSYSSTGKVGEFSLPTPLGYYMAITKKIKFDYLEDGTSDIVGFAPYAIRFSGGGYLHGVPMEYGFTESGGKISPKYYREYLASIGTIPKSHMCVRNYTSHAEFMYDWVDIGNCAVIVME